MKRSSRGGRGKTSERPGGVYFLLIVTLFVAVVALNFADLWTSARAMAEGLSEGNNLVLGIARALGIQVLQSLAIVKLVAIAGGLFAALVGIGAFNGPVRRSAVYVLFLMALILLAVSVNNLVRIVV